MVHNASGVLEMGSKNGPFIRQAVTLQKSERRAATRMGRSSSASFLRRSRPAAAAPRAEVRSGLILPPLILSLFLPLSISLSAPTLVFLPIVSWMRVPAVGNRGGGGVSKGGCPTLKNLWAAQDGAATRGDLLFSLGKGVLCILQFAH